MHVFSFVFQRGCNSSSSYQQEVESSYCSTSIVQLILSDFLSLAYLETVKWYLIMVLICIFLITNLVHSLLISSFMFFIYCRSVLSNITTSHM